MENLNESEPLDLLRQYRCVFEGHVATSSGLHTALYVDKSRMLHEPKLLKQLCFLMSEPLQHMSIDFVVSPETGGIVFGFKVAEILGQKFSFLEKVDGRREFINARRFPIRAGDRVLLVDDVAATGETLKVCESALTECGAEVVLCAVVVDRTRGTPSDFLKLPNARIHPLIEMDEPKNFLPSECPLCAAGEDLQSVEELAAKHV